MSAEQTPDIETVLRRHQLTGVSIWAAECACGQQEGVDYYTHVAQALAPVLAAAVREARAEAWDEGYDARGVDISNEGLTERTLTRNPYRAVDVTECPDCGETGHYDRRVTVGGRGIYTCPSRHQWQDANETPDNKGYAPLTAPTAEPLCPTCGPTKTEQHPRRDDVTRCSNCKEWLDRADWVAEPQHEAATSGKESEASDEDDELTYGGRVVREVARTGNDVMDPWSFVPCAREHRPGYVCILPDGHDDEGAGDE